MGIKAVIGRNCRERKDCFPENRGMGASGEMKEYLQVEAGPEACGAAGWDLDNLTGVWNERSVTAQITGRMHEGGTLFLCDMDRLRRINDQFGHRAGDTCLKQMAQVLGYMIRRDDILGRIGGDEFLIFMSDCKEEQTAEEVCRRIEARFHSNRKKGGREADFSVTSAYTVRKKGDTYRTMLERAEQELSKRKAEFLTGGRKGGRDSCGKDARQIREELTERISRPGAFCQDYDTFKSIYRFIERGIVRSGQKACVILFSVVDAEGNSIIPFEKDVLMEWLGKAIRSTLRIGDVYTRYSSGQYLVLVIDTTERMADIIADRIRNKFLEGIEQKSLLIHYCYELRPARIEELQREERC